MAGERRLRILSMLASEGADLTTARLCEVSVEVTAVSGAGIMLMSGNVAQGSVCTSNEVSALIEQLQFALGEGPCLDAFHQDRPVLEPDLVHPVMARWLAFSGPAIEAGVRGIFGFPLRVGAVRLGALNLYCDQPRLLSDEQHTDALVMADVVAQAVLALQADAPPGKLAVALEVDADFQYVVHQASGMVAAQLDVDVGQALIRLKAYAFGNGRPLAQVAEYVVARELRFDADGGKTDA
jgi:GAF domain-containing protein